MDSPFFLEKRIDVNLGEEYKNVITCLDKEIKTFEQELSDKLNAYYNNINTEAWRIERIKALIIMDTNKKIKDFKIYYILKQN